jgi:hypothetical protein
MLFISWTWCKICLFAFILLERALSVWNILRGAQAIKFWETLVYALRLMWVTKLQTHTKSWYNYGSVCFDLYIPRPQAGIQKTLKRIVSHPQHKTQLVPHSADYSMHWEWQAACYIGTKHFHCDITWVKRRMLQLECKYFRLFNVVYLIALDFTLHLLRTGIKKINSCLQI